jgi:hypothetical protein
MFRFGDQATVTAAPTTAPAAGGGGGDAAAASGSSAPAGGGVGQQQGCQNCIRVLILFWLYFMQFKNISKIEKKLLKK